VGQKEAWRQMDNNTLKNLYYIATAWSNLMLIPAIIILGVTLPKIIKEARDKEALTPFSFRLLLLVSTGSIFVLSIIALVIIDIRFIFRLEAARWISFVLLIVFTTIIPIYAVAKRRIYNFNFSQSQTDTRKGIEAQSEKNKKRRLFHKAKKGKKLDKRKR
jgi:heme/copper-type cytochrome/quinol oxidase subunit 2